MWASALPVPPHLRASEPSVIENLEIVLAPGTHNHSLNGVDSPISQSREVRVREVKQLASSHTANREGHLKPGQPGSCPTLQLQDRDVSKTSLDPQRRRSPPPLKGEPSRAHGILFFFLIIIYWGDNG